MEAERRGADIQRELRVVDPRVVEIYETGDLDGYFFVAMQFVEGRDLAEVLREEHTIDSVRAAAIALEICEQLTKFHNWRRCGGARRHQAIEHSSGAERYGAAAGLRDCEDAAGGLRGDGARNSAARVIVRRRGWRGRRWTSSRICGR